MAAMDAWTAAIHELKHSALVFAATSKGDYHFAMCGWLSTLQLLFFECYAFICVLILCGILFHD
jgi:hypothetical protein